MYRWHAPHLFVLMTCENGCNSIDQLRQAALTTAQLQPYNITCIVSMLSQLTAAITLDRYSSNDVHVSSTPSHAISKHALAITFVHTLLRGVWPSALPDNCYLHAVSRVLVHAVVEDICASCWLRPRVHFEATMSQFVLTSTSRSWQ